MTTKTTDTQETARQAIAGNLRAELARGCLGTAALADALGLSHDTARRKLAGRTELTATELVAAAAWLQVDLACLVAGADDTRATSPYDVDQLPGQAELLTRQDVAVALGMAGMAPPRLVTPRAGDDR